MAERRLFEDLIDSDKVRHRTNQSYTLPVSLAIHAVIISVVVLVPLLMSEELPEPTAAVKAFFVEPAPPPPPPPPPVSVAISPTSASVRVSRTQQFVATVKNTTVTKVTWKVNGVAGGNNTVGKISSGGLYTAPSTVPSSSHVTISATSTADSTKSASAVVTITRR